MGTELWVKRDDCTGGPEAGNKLRKLEFLCADALRAGCDTLITCGAVQSNHARATALTAARLGLDCVLFLRVEGSEAPSVEGNLLLDRLTGAAVHFVDHPTYADRDRLMAEAAAALSRRGHSAYVIPEGGSNALGALGYVEAMKEVKAQLPKDLGDDPPFDAIVVACGSGGTAAGCAVGAHTAGLARRVLAMAVCDDRAYFEPRINAIVADLETVLGKPTSSVPVEVLDHAMGPGYGKCSQQQLEFLALVAKSSGILLDPVYTAKALFGLKDRATSLSRVLFVHTGGLPGLLAQARAFDTLL